MDFQISDVHPCPSRPKQPFPHSRSVFCVLNLAEVGEIKEYEEIEECFSSIDVLAVQGIGAGEICIPVVVVLVRDDFSGPDGKKSGYLQCTLGSC